MNERAEEQRQGCRARCVGIRRDAISGILRVPSSGSEVNLLIDGVCGERLPTIDFSHVALPRGEQRPEQHRSSIGRRQHGLGLLNSSCRRSIAFVVLALRHWLGGMRVKVKRRRAFAQDDRRSSSSRRTRLVIELKSPVWRKSSWMVPWGCRKSHGMIGMIG